MDLYSCKYFIYDNKEREQEPEKKKGKVNNFDDVLQSRPDIINFGYKQPRYGGGPRPSDNCSPWTDPTLVIAYTQTKEKNRLI